MKLHCIMGLKSTLELLYSAIIINETHKPKFMIINGYDLDILLSRIRFAFWSVDSFELMQWDYHLLLIGKMYEWVNNKQSQSITWNVKQECFRYFDLSIFEIISHYNVFSIDFWSTNIHLNNDEGYCGILTTSLMFRCFIPDSWHHYKVHKAFIWIT